MSIINYPPQIEKKLSAFVYDGGDVTIINIPYLLNKAISFASFNKMAVSIKTTTTGTVKWTGETNECKMYSNVFHSYYASFTIPKTDFTPTPGNYYKIQIAFRNGTDQSNWSSVGIIKCIYTPTLTIDSLVYEVDNINPNIFIGLYENLDSTEKVYSYNFTIYDDKNKLYETSNDIIHNGTNDEILIGVGIRSTLQWKPIKELKPYVRYKIALSITTINGYSKTTAPYVVKAVNTVDANIPAKLLAVPDYDNGCISLSLIKNDNLDKEQAFSGSFIISRYSENLDSWNEIYRFNMISQKPSDMGILWTDYTVEHGVKYLYALQSYNSNELHSNKMYHVILNPDASGKTYLEYDELGKPFYIMGDFEDMFLTDSTRQLKIRFDPKVSSYKPTILEHKVDTMGGQYPFIFRNGSVNYKEFSISGLLSYLSDEKELFMQGIQPPENSMIRNKTIANSNNVAAAGTLLTSDTFFRERQFKTEVLQWLTNGEPKLFRSAGEGSYIVRLMNVSLSPNDTLGRMLHTFNATAYEIAENNFDNLKKYKLIYLPDSNASVMKFVEINLGEHSIDNVYSPGCNMYNVSIVNASPWSRYSLHFSEIASDIAVTYEIGLTGALHLDTDSYPVSSIRKESGDENNTAILRYGYYDTAIPDNFHNISDITIRDEITQIIGTNYMIDIISEQLEDEKRQVDRFYSLVIKPRKIEKIYFKNDKYYNLLTRNEIDCWIPTTIYQVVSVDNNLIEKEEDAVYYIYGNDSQHIQTAIPPEMRFKLNDMYDIDLSKGNTLTYGQTFISYTQGSYRVECDIGEVQSLHLGSGVYAEMAYNLKEIEYAVEAKDADVIAAKAALKDAQEQWLMYEGKPDATPSERTTAKNIMIHSYSAYISALKAALANNLYKEINYVV